MSELLISLSDAIDTRPCYFLQTLSHDPIVSLNRRDFISSAISASAIFAGNSNVFGAGNDVRIVELLALHTNEYIRAPYRVDGALLTGNLPDIDHLLRDHRTEETHPIDPLLLDYLHDLSGVLGLAGPFHVISGYRSASTNAKLRRFSSGVAKRSLHMEGRAVDIRVPDVPAAQVREAAISLRYGGVGFYPSSDFVHLDTGRFRHW